MSGGQPNTQTSTPSTQAGRALVDRFVEAEEKQVDVLLRYDMDDDETVPVTVLNEMDFALGCGAVSDAVVEIEKEAREPLRDAIQFDAIPTLLVFAQDNGGVQAVIEKLRRTLDEIPAASGENYRREHLFTDRDWAIRRAEAQDQTDRLREALDAHVWEAGFNIHGCRCGWRTKGLVSVASALWLDHRYEAVRAALAQAAPPSRRHPQLDKV